MKTAYCLSIFIFVGIFTTNLATTFAQTGESIQQHNDFHIQRTASLGFQGIKTSIRYRLVDELGLEYDVISLLNKSEVAESVEIDADQFAELRSAAYVTEQAISKEFAAIITEENHDKIEAAFRDLQTDLYSMLDDEQIEKIHQARDRLGIETHGLKKYLSTSRAREQMGLSETQVNSIALISESGKSKLLTTIKDLTRQANEAIVEQIESPHREQFESLLDSKSTAAFMATSLYKSKKSLKAKRPRNYATLVGLIRNNSVRDQIEMEPSQYDTLKLVKRHARTIEDSEIKAALDENLRPDQLKQLLQLAATSQLKEYGTVHSLCFGIIANDIGLTEEKANKLFEIGKEIEAELSADIRSAKEEFLRQSLGSLEGDQVEKIIEVACQADLFKSKK